MQSRNHSSGCWTTPRQPLSCQMRRQHLRCCQPRSTARMTPQTHRATHRCIAIAFRSFFYGLMRCFVGKTGHWPTWLSNFSVDVWQRLKRTDQLGQQLTTAQNARHTQLLSGLGFIINCLGNGRACGFRCDLFWVLKNCYKENVWLFCTNLYKFWFIILLFKVAIRKMFAYF